ncbi:hypothetical protein [Bacillus toyonensis]|uniref:hypothetical protein n=1 Tax=Bacillus toyonensis TaxID=155322 RepID=UPI0025424B44|nr:hypothetical protein [Bacillus toyonensis]WIG41988.1 hypothetical protein QPL84_26830 [Bacillus toyonensis]
MGIDSKKAILANYNSIAFRSCGGGVLEILPRELENVRIPNMFDLNIEEVLNLIDKIILIE